MWQKVCSSVQRNGAHARGDQDLKDSPWAAGLSRGEDALVRTRGAARAHCVLWMLKRAFHLCKEEHQAFDEVVSSQQGSPTRSTPTRRTLSRRQRAHAPIRFAWVARGRFRLGFALASAPPAPLLMPRAGWSSTKGDGSEIMDPWACSGMLSGGLCLPGSAPTCAVSLPADEDY